MTTRLRVYAYDSKIQQLTSQVARFKYDHKRSLVVNCLYYSLKNPQRVVVVEAFGYSVTYYKEGKIQRSPLGTLFDPTLLRPTVGQLNLVEGESF